MAEQIPSIVEIGPQNFESEVVERSRQVPVVLDFWAPWCDPCRQLTPMLERIVGEHAGKVVLGKVNIDESPQLASTFGIQSIPFVVAISDGQPVNQFQGLLPEDQLREWFQSFLPSPADDLLKAGQSLEDSDPQGAELKYREAIAQAPQDATPKIRLANLLLQQGRQDESREIIEQLEARGYLEPEAERIKSQLDMQAAAEEAGGVEEARQAVEAHPDDLSLKLKLADALAVENRYEEAFDICLDLIARDKTGIGEEAKQRMVKMFDMIGPESELVGRYRRKLATVLY